MLWQYWWEDTLQDVSPVYSAILNIAADDLDPVLDIVNGAKSLLEQAV